MAALPRKPALLVRCANRLAALSPVRGSGGASDQRRDFSAALALRDREVILNLQIHPELR
jgi:hypothetical protein